MAESTPPALTRPAVVETDAGPVRGEDDGTAASWKGIRFAAPPTGDLRWRAPVPPEPWTEVADATRFGPACAQAPNPILLGPGNRTGEDCLFLNVWAPSSARDGTPVPVMVWVHGGAFVFGAGSQPLYDGRALTGDGVVVVTVNYRLGTLGFLELATLDDGARFDTNVGIRDVVRALEWVRDNIAAFGGDPDRVTLFGESAGASITTALLTAPAATGLFHRAIVQSSPATSAYDPERGRRVAELVLDKLGIDAAQARSVPVDVLVDAGAHAFERIPTATPGILPFAPTVDGDLVPDYPVPAARDGGSHPVPLILGTNRDEAALFRWLKSPPILPVAPKAIREMFERIAVEQPELALPTEADIDAAYPGIRPRARGLHVARDVAFRMPTVWFAEGHSRVAPTYLYRFDWATPMLRLLRLGAAHAAEMPYMWGNLSMGPRDVTFKLGGRKRGALLSQRMRARWTNFAKGLEPTGPAGQPWRPYTVTDRATLCIDRDDALVDDLDRDIRAAWGSVVIGFR